MTKKTAYAGGIILSAFMLLFMPLNLFAGEKAGDRDEYSREEYLTILTDEEREYLEEEQVISVILSARKGPIQYLDRDGKQKGISKDILEEISRITGLRFEFITMDGMADIQNMINSGGAHMVSGVPPETAVREAYDIIFSSSYLDCPYGIVLDRGNSLRQPQDLTLALTAGLDVPITFQHVKEVKYYNSIQDCLKAVKKGEADFTYGNAYVLEFYAQGYELQSLCVIPLNDASQNICFGVSSREDARLVGILDKTLEYLGSERLLAITVANVAASTQPVTLAFLISANPRWSLFLGLLLLGLILVMAMLVTRNYKHKNKLAIMEHQRYLMISAAAKDYFFEYQCRTDTLTLSRDMAELFGCRKVLHRWKSHMHRYARNYHFDAGELSGIMLDGGLAAEEGQRAHSREFKLTIRDGQERWFRVTRLPVYDKGKAVCIVGKLTDIQEEYQEREKLMQKSLSDGLTGLYNVAATRELVGRLLRNQRKGTFFMIDLDYFKNINDRFGHQKGDEMLISFAGILKTAFRGDDIVGRIGGDEFVIFAKDAWEDSFIVNKCRLLQEMAGKIPVAEGYTQTVSIGVAKVGQQSDYDSLYQHADVALYEVKKKGRNGYKIAGEKENPV